MLVLCLSGSALAEQELAAPTLSVKSVYDDCKGRNLNFCNGFLLGVANGLEVLRTHNPKFSDEYCPDQLGDTQSYREIFIRWAEHSKFWKMKPFDGALIAFWIAAPCPNTEMDLS
jgi:hypothetical protein